MTYIILIITGIISFTAFNRPEIMYRYNLNPYQVVHRKQWFRIVSHGFLHADWMHLIINMMVFLSFGEAVESIFKSLSFSGYIKFPLVHFFILYFGGMTVATISTLFKHKDNYHYNAVGASGAVSAIVFTSIFFAPMNKILFFMIIPVPGILFGILYLVYCHVMSKKSNDTINHEAHLWGAVFGFLYPLLINVKFISIFLNQLHF